MKNKIKLYTSPSCSHCQALKVYLKSKRIEYQEIDITVDQDSFSEAVTKSGAMQLPIIEYNEKYISGFNIKEIDNILKNE
jgi:glutaredoxin